MAPSPLCPWGRSYCSFAHLLQKLSDGAETSSSKVHTSSTNSKETSLSPRSEGSLVPSVFIAAPSRTRCLPWGGRPSNSEINPKPAGSPQLQSKDNSRGLVKYRQQQVRTKVPYRKEAEQEAGLQSLSVLGLYWS